MDKVGLRIGVLMGGPSAERDVSLRSGKAITDALLNIGIYRSGDYCKSCR